MARSTEEAKAYSRGYYRANVTNNARLRRMIDIARRYVARCLDHETPRNCVNCARWTRGAGSNDSARCQWGSCRADFEWSVEARMWIDHPLGTPKLVEAGSMIITQPQFGCVSWIPKNGSQPA